MLKRILCLILLTTNLLASEQIPVQNFASIPILNEGRITPIDSIARSNLIFTSAKDHLGDLTATEWFTELLFYPRQAYQRNCFKIHNPDLLTLLQLTKQDNNLYSFIQITNSLQKQAELISVIVKKSQEDLTLIEKQLLELHFKHLRFYQLSRSLAYLLPDFNINSPELQELLNTKTKVSYIELLSKVKIMTDTMVNITNKTELSQVEQNLLSLVKQMQIMSYEAKNNIFYNIPKDSHNWYNIPEYLKLKPDFTTDNYLNIWQNLATAYQGNNITLWEQNINLLQNELRQNLNTENLFRLKLETLYNKYDLFNKTVICYLITLALLFIGSLIRPKQKLFYSKLAFYSLCLASVIQLLAIIMRIVIMARPPVSTLYESIIFVAFIVSIFAVLLQNKKRSNYLTISASVINIILLFIADKYNINQDSFQMLEAVLNSNFWLGTHVLTITIGYGCCLICATLAHIYLILSTRKNHDTKALNELLKNITIISLIALFFASTGTILGGIWADQSWGRFWGWDPKENGALFICLWLIFMLHGKIAKLFNNFHFAIGIAALNIVVALAWYGVNLLNVGLHSYGFTNNIATNLIIFCGSELLFIVAMLVINKKRRHFTL